jgi:hypothetical protein
MTTNSNHRQFLAALKAIADPARVDEVSRFFDSDPNAGSSDNKTLDVSPGKVFPVLRYAVEKLPLTQRAKFLG